MAPKTKRLTFSYAQVAINGAVAKVANIYAHLERGENEGKVYRYCTNKEGRLCLKKTTDAESGKPVKEVGNVWFKPGIAYEGMFVAEGSFQPKTLEAADKKAVKAEPDATGLMTFKLEVAPASSYKPLETDILEFVKPLPDGLTKEKLTNGDGVAPSTYEKYRKLMADLFGPLQIDRAIDSALEAGKDEKVKGDWRVGSPYKEDKVQYPKGVALENVYFKSGDADATEVVTGAPADKQDLKTHQQLWSLKKKVNPAKDIDPAMLVNYGSDIAARLEVRIQQTADARKIKHAEAGAVLMTQDFKDMSYAGKFLDPKLARGQGDTITAANVDGIAKNLWWGISAESYEGAVADALGKASRTFQSKIVSTASDTQRAGKAGEEVEVESLIAATAFPFATDHDLYDFGLVSVKDRVKAWWASLSACKRALVKGGLIKVDAYASEAGKADYNKALAGRRLESVVDALITIPECLGEIVEKNHGPVGAGTKPTADNPDALPDPECFTSADVFADDHAFQLRSESGGKNPWKHRVVTVRMYQKVKVAPDKDGRAGGEVIRGFQKTQSAMPIAKVVVVAVQRWQGVCYALVLIAPADPRGAIG